MTPYHYDRAFNKKFKAPKKEYTPLREGWYRVVVIGAEQKPNKKGSGEYLHVELKVGEGQEGEGKTLHCYFNNIGYDYEKQAKEHGRDNVEVPFWIARGREEETMFMDSIEIASVNSTDDLLGKKLEVAVITEEYDHPERGKMTTNRVTDWRPTSAHTTTAAPEVDDDDELPDFMRK